MSTSSLVKREPVLVAHAVAWLFLQGGLIAVGRYHLLSTSSWSALSSALAPVVTAAAMGLLALLVRRVVTPAVKWVETEAPDAASVVKQALNEAQAVFPMPAPDSAVPPATPAAPGA